jgi:adenine phosphoribosyltransferase
MHIDAIAPRARALLVDDLLATGGTMRAGCELIRKAGGQVIGCAVLVELTFLGGRDKLAPYEVFSLIRY